MPSWGYSDMVQFCDEASPVTKGMLNNTYEGLLDGRRVFVRHRLYDDDPAFAQTFAAERFVRPLLDASVLVPELLHVVPGPCGRERFAIFDHVDGVEPDWTSSEVLVAVARTLASVHAVRGSGFGDINDDALAEVDAAEFLGGLFDTEFRRAGNEAAGMAQTVEAALVLFEDEAPCLCHGDVWQQNWLWSSDERLWTVDWEAARFRVAAADFNQMQGSWLDEAQRSTVLETYLRVTGRDPQQFSLQVLLLQLLWRVRTRNFLRHLNTRLEEQQTHLAAAHGLVERIDGGLKKYA